MNSPETRLYRQADRVRRMTVLGFGRGTNPKPFGKVMPAGKAFFRRRIVGSGSNAYLLRLVVAGDNPVARRSVNTQAFHIWRPARVQTLRAVRAQACPTLAPSRLRECQLKIVMPILMTTFVILPRRLCRTPSAAMPCPPYTWWNAKQNSR